MRYAPEPGASDKGGRLAECGIPALLAPGSFKGIRYASMHLDEASLREFAEIWRQEFGETLSLDEARHHASRLLELYALLYRPTPEEESLARAGPSAQTP